MLEELEEKIGYTFVDKNLLLQAITHSSYANFHHTKDYERMEFLGDSILGMVVTQALFAQFPCAHVGDLTETRKSLVSADILAKIVLEHGLQKYILTKKLSTESGKIVSDVFESIVAAIYLDGGLENSAKFIEQSFGEMLSNAKIVSKFDALTTLKEIFDKLPNALIYDCFQEPDTINKPQFVCNLLVDNVIRATAQGSSKKEAQESCAKMLLDELNANKKKKMTNKQNN
ncbi:MAG: ribonuclease III [Clostridia bacterium]